METPCVHSTSRHSPVTCLINLEAPSCPLQDVFKQEVSLPESIQTSGTSYFVLVLGVFAV